MLYELCILNTSVFSGNWLHRLRYFASSLSRPVLPSHS
ncbi:Protein of unknown function [Pyronema omphalodes CBS 100304]|uniref:Uncharacterized protein n=1 Tax=Pyronema omphalodes (strain CBS 100304) TaxID=1076935 RepID=U4LIM7_PYROM|nr:Protein of unknown function [Pyronema omphalodes CBS 100304]